ncbi:SDR family NAD(P)-dependent oxidoreductase [Thalassotalea euphylliae]|uniref:SDR family NAD(P)-dependent oxidoreductase n=1 Tax=Thalassotalea euphylliae TaxID=1655234 RepID=UPI0036385B4A
MKVLITGATSGIGLSLVERYSRSNYDVIACGRSEEKLSRLKTQFPKISTLVFDITDNIQINKAISAIENLDVAILNAGDCEYIDDVMAFDADLFARVVTVNLISMGYLVSALIPKLNQQGTLALMSSSVTNLPFPRAQAYGASKAGVDYLAKTLELELTPKGIHVALIHPGFIKTPLTDKNDFDMPFLMTSDEAAERIFDGIGRGKSLIQFPKRFMYLMKFIAILPKSWWARMVLKGS